MNSKENPRPFSFLSHIIYYKYYWAYIYNIQMCGVFFAFTYVYKKEMSKICEMMKMVVMQ